jgi:micrococcal nuclease
MDSTPSFPPAEYRGKVVRVIDGDTIVVDVDLGFYIWTRIHLRLAGIDTPELRSKDPDEKLRAQEAKAFVESLVDCRWILFRPQKGKSFDRWVGSVSYAEEVSGYTAWVDLSDALFQAGHQK